MLTTNQIAYNLSGVVRHLGLPVSGVQISLLESPLGGRSGSQRTGRLVDKHITSPRGDFSFAVGPGNYRLDIVPDSATCFVRQIIDDIKIASNSNCNITLTTGPVLQGLVTGLTEHQIQQSEVIVVGIEPQNWKMPVPIEDKGRFAVALPKGRYHVVVCPRLEYTDERVSSLMRVLEEAAGADEKFFAWDHVAIDFDRDAKVVLKAPDTVSFAAKVVDPGGKPVSGVLVSLKPSVKALGPEFPKSLLELGAKVVCKSDKDGSFEVFVQPGAYDILIQPSEFSPLMELREEAVNIESDATHTYKLSRGVILAGMVRNASEPVSDCPVEVKGSKPGIVFSTSTTEDGRFNFAVAPDNYVIRVNPRINLNLDEALAPWCQVQNIAGDQELQVELENGYLLYGHVCDLDAQPRPDVSVAIYRDIFNKKINAESHPLAICTTDAEGRYVFTLEPGKYLIVINDDYTKLKAVSLGKKAERLDLTAEGVCIVRMKVVSEEDEPIAGCQVIYGPYRPDQPDLAVISDAVPPGTITGSFVTADTGICQMTMPAGVYFFHLQPPADSSFDVRTIRQLSIGGDFKRKIRLSRKEH